MNTPGLREFEVLTLASGYDIGGNSAHFLLYSPLLDAVCVKYSARGIGAEQWIPMHQLDAAAQEGVRDLIAKERAALAAAKKKETR